MYMYMYNCYMLQIDLHNADVPETINQMCVGFGFEEDEIHKVHVHVITD